MNGYSIVICCYNSSKRLPVTLKHIAALKVPANHACELLIINNASTDDTKNVAMREWARYNCDIQFRIMEESELGLSYARRKGFSEARYDYIICCDDDNWLDEDYLMKAKSVFDNNDNIGVLGGNGELYSEGKHPEWVYYTKGFAVGSQEKSSGPVINKRVYGAGAVIYKPAYDELINAGFRNLLTDRMGNSLTSGGDYEICSAIALAGYEIWYEEDLRFKHYFPAERLSLAYYQKLMRESVSCLTVLDSYTALFYKGDGYTRYGFMYYIIKHAFYFVKQLMKYIIRWFFVNSKTDYGVFVRMRVAFYYLRVKGLLSNVYSIYWNTKKLNNLKNSIAQKQRVLKDKQPRFFE
jgi:glycosyltransferase involved in cell wall biosynthesis